MTRKAGMVALLVAIAAGFLLRVGPGFDHTFWFDEAHSLEFAKFNTMELPSSLSADVHPPFYFLLLKIWIALAGTSASALRFASVLCGIATIACVYGCAGAAASLSGKSACCSRRARATAAAAAALVATSSAQVVWAQQVRMYALACVETTAAAWLLLLSLRGGRLAIPSWLGFAACSVAQVYTHNFTLFTLLFEAGFCAAFIAFSQRTDAAASWRRVAAVRACVAFACIGLCYLPWVSTLRRQASTVSDDFWIPAMEVWTVPEAVKQILAPREDGETPVRSHCLLAVGFVALVLAASLGRPTWGRVFIAGMIVFPLAASMVVSILTRPIMVPRYLVMSFLFLAVAVADLAIRMRSPGRRWGIVLLLLCGNLFAHWTWTRDIDPTYRPGLRAALGHIVSNWTPRPIVVLKSTLYYSVRYYLEDLGIEPLLLTSPKGTPHYFGGSLLSATKCIQESELREFKGREVWFIDSDAFMRQREPPLAGWTEVAGSRIEMPEGFRGLGSVYVQLLYGSESPPPDREVRSR